MKKYIYLICLFSFFSCIKDTKDHVSAPEMLSYDSHSQFDSEIKSGIEPEDFYSMNDYVTGFDLSNIKESDIKYYPGLHIENIDGDLFVRRDVDAHISKFITKEGLVKIGSEVWKYGRDNVVSKLSYSDYKNGKAFVPPLEQRAVVFSKSCTMVWRQNCSGNLKWKGVCDFRVVTVETQNPDGTYNFGTQQIITYYKRGIFGIWFESNEFESLGVSSSVGITYDALGGSRELFTEQYSFSKGPDPYSNGMITWGNFPDPSTINVNTLLVVSLGVDFWGTESGSCTYYATCHIGL